MLDVRALNSRKVVEVLDGVVEFVVATRERFYVVNDSVLDKNKVL